MIGPIHALDTKKSLTAGNSTPKPKAQEPLRLGAATPLAANPSPAGIINNAMRLWR
jgi:hypothetical protein